MNVAGDVIYGVAALRRTVEYRSHTSCDSPAREWRLYNPRKDVWGKMLTNRFEDTLNAEQVRLTLPREYNDFDWSIHTRSRQVCIGYSARAC